MFIYKNHRVHFCIRMQVIFTPSRLTLPLFQLVVLYALSQLCAALPACYFDSDCTSGSSYCCHEREVSVRAHTHATVRRFQAVPGPAQQGT